MVTAKQINDFLCDENYLAVTEASREHRLLFITDLSETRVSAFLGWLFRPHEGHGLEDQAVRELLQNAWREVHGGDWEGPGWEAMGYGDWTPARVARRSFRDLCVETEYRFGKPERAGEKNRPADVVLVSRSNRLVVVIENKFGTAVHSEQLKAYREQAARSFEGCAVFRIYLDPNAENRPDDPPYWIPLRYDWLVELISARDRANLLSDRARHALLQVTDYLKQDGDAEAGGTQAQLSALVSAHPEVLAEMRRLKAMGKHGRLTAPAEAIGWDGEVLLTEYHQRHRLWDAVFDQMQHLPLLAALGQRLEERKLNKRIQFRWPGWAAIRDDVLPARAAWALRLAAWKPEGDGGLYTVRSLIDFNPVELEDNKLVSPFTQQQESILRGATGALRTFGRKASPEDRWVRLMEEGGLSAEQAAKTLLSETERINEVLRREGLLPNPKERHV